MRVELRRRAAFCAAHNYWLKALSDDQNRELFGKWAAGSGHGHNYEVEVTVGGEIDLSTGMVVNIVDIDRVLKRHIIGALDGKFLNVDVAYFYDHPPTLENISKYCWDRIEPVLPRRASLSRIRVWEMTTLWSDRYRSEQGMQVSITRSYDFSASHRLHSRNLTDQENLALFGKCNNPNGHGHNYGVEVTLTGEPDERSGMLFGIEDIDLAVQEEVLQRFDHKYLNLDVADFQEVNPTSEMLTVVIWNRLAKRLPTAGKVRLSSVVVRETARNSFEYSGG